MTKSTGHHKKVAATRELALLRGEPTYFTGFACRRGHLAPRHTIGGACTVCKHRAYHDRAAVVNRRQPHVTVMRRLIVECKVRYGWSDRGRSAITREQVVEEVLLAQIQYEIAMRPLLKVTRQPIHERTP